MPARPIYITTPIYYVNDIPHIGHSYTTIAADVFSRYHRLAGREVFFLTGTDEHGAKIAEAASDAGKEPQEFCDEIVKHFKSAWSALDVEPDDFIRTTEERHLQGVKKVLERLKSAKTPDGQEVIYRSTYEGLYCIGCEKYLTERDLVDGLCPYHKTAPKLVSEENWFFRLSAYLPEIKRLVESEELLILPVERRREVLGLIEQGPPDFSISREKVKWGVPVPFDPEQSAYVWVDALSNYITAIGYGADQPLFDKWWNQADVIHLMAKDILKFHCLFWPAMLLALGEKLPQTVFLHGFFTLDGEKMSKSLGNSIAPGDMVDVYGPDGARYLLLTLSPFGIDGDIQISRFTEKFNSDLANELGNLLSRVVKMIEKHFDGKLPKPFNDTEGMQGLLSLSDDLAGKVYEEISAFRPHGAIDAVRGLVRECNKYFDLNAPWKLIKDGQLEKAGGVLYACCEALRLISILLHPVMPAKMSELRSVFSLDESTLTLDDARKFFCLEPGLKLQLKETLFPRIQKPFTIPGKSAVEENVEADEDGLVDISEFGRLDFRVAEVVEAATVEGADRLLCLQISLGDHQRQIVAGVASHYTPEQIKGMKIIVVANLKPAVIRGVKSEGMLLAAKKGKKLTLITPASDIPAGASVG